MTVSDQNCHSRCLFCGRLNPRSLNLRFSSGGDGVVKTQWKAEPDFQGYDDILHGGVIAGLLDAAMTHCLFHRGIQGLTGDLHVRFVHPVPFDAQLDIRAWVEAGRKSAYRLRAECACEGTIMAWAEATFMRRQRQ